MSRVETALEELIAAVIASEEYREYDRQKQIMKEQPELKAQIDRFRQCGCTAAFGGNRRTDVFCGGVKARCHVEKRTARNSRRQYDCEICGKIAFAEELDRKFVIEL